MERWRAVIEPMIDQTDLTVTISGLEGCGFETRQAHMETHEADPRGPAPVYYEKHVIRIGRWRGVILRTYDFATQSSTMQLIAHGNGSHPVRAAKRRCRRSKDQAIDMET